MLFAACLCGVSLYGFSPAAAPVATWDAVVASYGRVHDYTCLYLKQERAISGGELQRIRLSFRKPLDVRMEWLDAKGRVDQIAVYRQGFNDGKLVGRRMGILGSMIGTVHMAPTDRRALDDSRHPITEAGIGSIVDGIARAARDGVLRDPSVVEPRSTADGIRFAWTIAPNASFMGVAGVQRLIVVVNPEQQLPADVQLLDASGAFVEHHRFSEIRTNVGLSDAVFTLQ